MKEGAIPIRSKRVVVRLLKLRTQNNLNVKKQEVLVESQDLYGSSRKTCLAVKEQSGGERAGLYINYYKTS